MRNNKIFGLNEINYKDLAIAVVLSGASLLLTTSISGTANAAATNDTSTTSTETEVTANTAKISSPSISNDASTGVAQINLPDQSNDEITGTSSVNDSINSSNLNSDPATSATNGTSKSDTTTIDNSTATSNVPSPSDQSNSETDLTSDATGETSGQGEDQISTDPNATNIYQASENEWTANGASDNNSLSTGEISPAFKVPSTGIKVTNYGSTPTSENLYVVYLQAFDNYNKPLSKVISISSGVNDSIMTSSWQPLVFLRFKASMGDNADYLNTPYNPDYLDSPITVTANGHNLLVSIYFMDPKVEANYEFVDEDTGQVISQQTDSYSYKSSSDFGTTGIRPAMDILSGNTMTVANKTDTADSDPDDFPYFGPTGMIYNSDKYVLDLAKSGNVTPLDYSKWPDQDFTKIFYYKEATAPTVTVDAVNQYGDLLKTFSSSQIPSTTMSYSDYLPAATDINIANNTFSGVNIIEANSLSGQPNKTINDPMTIDQYPAFLDSSTAQQQKDVRTLGDYQNIEYQLTYNTEITPLYVQPVDPNGDNIGDPISVGIGEVGQNANIFAPSVDGYDPLTSSIDITVQPDQTPIDFPYISATDIDPAHGGSYLYSGKFPQLPIGGINIINTGTTTTDPTAEHSVSVQAVDTAGNPLGSLIPVTTAESNTSALINWSSALINLLNKSVKNISQYQLWNPSALTGEMNVPVKNQDVVVDVIYAIPKITTTYKFVDSTTGNNILTETNTWDLNDPNNGYTYQTQGIRPPMTIIDPDSGQLEADDETSDPQTDPAKLPFFGPAGNTFNTNYYQLDTTKNGSTTPMTYIAWPTGDVTKIFYYTENPDPTITIEAVNQAGDVIKVFNSPTVVSSLPAPQLSPAKNFPTASDVAIDGYTLTGLKVHATGDYFGGTDTDYSYTFTPDQYAAFLNSPSAQNTMDERALAAHKNFGIYFTYTGDPVDLIVQPVDQSGNNISKPITISDQIVGSTVTIPAPTVSGYQAVEPSVDVSVKPDPAIIQLTYQKVTPTNPDSGGTGTGQTDSGNTGTGTTTGGSTNVDSGSASSTTNSGTASETGSSTDNKTEQTSEQTSAGASANGINTSVYSNNKGMSSNTEKKVNLALIGNVSQNNIEEARSNGNIQNENKLVATSLIGRQNDVTSEKDSVQVGNSQKKRSLGIFAKSTLYPIQSNKLPQTGNKFAFILSALGLGMLGVMLLGIKKFRKLI
ncbi:LPXTG cell wall anchor domain-containing protein [Companilactobacillus furfuricola]|uniref:LPXTG cell wall anchor domain-containing protein n=1 Tax=Companilactobacillus furfuricola TaxID=1462575 RepID=UPI000F77B566|nr:LPXTG cell wall anchor domain-containing protein [Companilactobacillus furfuricola]